MLDFPWLCWIGREYMMQQWKTKFRVGTYRTVVWGDNCIIAWGLFYTDPEACHIPTMSLPKSYECDVMWTDMTIDLFFGMFTHVRILTQPIVWLLHVAGAREQEQMTPSLASAQSPSFSWCSTVTWDPAALRLLRCPNCNTDTALCHWRIFVR